jgi:hypothetical protein
MGYMTLDNHCYYWARGMHTVATRAHSSDRPSDISEPLLLPPTVVTACMTSDDHCYYGACGTHVVSTSPHYIDRPSDISVLLLLSPTVVTGYMTSDDHCCCWACSTRTVATSPTVAMDVYQRTSSIKSYCCVFIRWSK